MRRITLAVPLLVATFAASAANPPPMSAAQVIQLTAAGAVAAGNCAKGNIAEHRRNAHEAAKQMLTAQHKLPKDFDAQFARAYDAEAKYMKAKSASERQAVCARLEAQGVHFNATPPKKKH
ncbi:hypothetical protein DWG18_13635 [Lysobacter sp. TY2-98]|uniref:hypothetical protein n=1 Tax=Lysobacter sp. TY2-98 TaxID=2290922 RepID=UPI000E1FFF66|nr:hypothetical protein [Lysobacter sp. TY2-98]AXK73221.1 hypothetical protein DWG18_13635 [Lysobacter sp. TY2-98]